MPASRVAAPCVRWAAVVVVMAAVAVGVVTAGTAAFGGRLSPLQPACVEGLAAVPYLIEKETRITATSNKQSLGARLTSQGPWALIQGVNPNTPAASAGVREGAVLATVCGAATAHLPLAKVANALQTCFRSRGAWVLGLLPRTHPAVRLRNVLHLKLIAQPLKPHGNVALASFREATCFAVGSNMQLLDLNKSNAHMLLTKFNHMAGLAAQALHTKTAKEAFVVVLARGKDQVAGAPAARVQRQQPVPKTSVTGSLLNTQVQARRPGDFGISVAESHVMFTGSPRRATYIVRSGSEQVLATGSGVRTGDVIMSVNNVDVRAWPHARVVNHLKAAARQRVIALKLFRPTDPQQFVPESRRRKMEDVAEVKPLGYSLRCSFTVPQPLVETLAVAQYKRRPDGSAVVPAPCHHAEFGAALPWRQPVDMAVAVVEPATGCNRAQARVAAGLAFDGDRVQHKRRRPWWAVVDRGDCYFHVKAQNAQSNGADGLIVVGSQFEPISPLGVPNGVSSAHVTDSIHIPVVTVPFMAGNMLRSAVVTADAFGNGVRNAPFIRFQYFAEKDAAFDQAFRLETVFGRFGKFSLGSGSVGYPTGAMGASTIKVKSTLLDFYHGRKDTLTVGRTRLCPHCKGRGGPQSAVRPCTMCSGHTHDGIPSGILEWSVGLSTNTTGVTQTRKETCPACQGTKEFILPGHRCPHCRGQRVVKVNKAFNVELPAGAPNHYQFRVPKEGNEGYNRPAGDLVFEFIQENDTVFTRDGPDLMTTVNITLKDALAGFAVHLTLPTGKQVTVNRTGTTGMGTVVRLSGEGLPLFDDAEPSAYSDWQAAKQAAEQARFERRGAAATAAQAGNRLPLPDEHDPDACAARCHEKDVDCLQDCLLAQDMGGDEDEEDGVGDFPHGDVVVSVFIDFPATATNATVDKRSEWRSAFYGTGRGSNTDSGSTGDGVGGDGETASDASSN